MKLKVLTLAVPLVLSFATEAAADQPSQAGTSAAPAASATALSGYEQQVSQVFDIPPRTQGGVSVTCPDGTKLYGGGAAVAGASLRDVNVNSSIPAPDGQTWDASINNSGRSDGSVTVWATCANPVADYEVVVGGDVPNPAGKQTAAEAFCPSGTVPFSGGGFSGSSNTAIKLNSSFSLARGWRVRMNNASPTDSTVAVYLVCGQRPAGYLRQVSGASTIAAHARGTARTLCPVGSVVLGGGGRSDSGSTAVDLNTSVPATDFGWLTYESNDTNSATVLRTYSTCARSVDA